MSAHAPRSRDTPLEHSSQSRNPDPHPGRFDRAPLAVVLVATLLAGCAGRAVPGPASNGCNDRDAEALVYAIAGMTAQPGASPTPTSGRLTLADSTSGDLDRDGVADLAAVVRLNSRGSGTFYYLNAVICDADGGNRVVGEAFLGDRIALETIMITAAGEIVVAFGTRSSGQPFAAAPDVDVSQRWQLRADTLQRVEQK